MISHLLSTALGAVIGIVTMFLAAKLTSRRDERLRDHSHRALCGALMGELRAVMEIIEDRWMFLLGTWRDLRADYPLETRLAFDRFVLLHASGYDFSLLPVELARHVAYGLRSIEMAHSLMMITAQEHRTGTLTDEMRTTRAHFLKALNTNIADTIQELAKESGQPVDWPTLEEASKRQQAALSKGGEQ